MGRKAGSEAERVALDRLKERHDQESKGYSAFFAVEDRRRELTIELDGLDVEQAEALTTIVAVSDPASVAEVIGWSATKVRSAVKLLSDGDPGGSEDGVHTAADVAS